MSGDPNPELQRLLTLIIVVELLLIMLRVLMA